MSAADTKARRDAARERGDCQRCYRRPGRVVNGTARATCEHCHEHHQRPLAAYRPLDEVLARPTVRVLRALQWFDGVTAADLLDALDIEDEGERNDYNHRLWWAGTRGYVRGERWGLYRITDAGRAWLAKQIARADVGVASDEEAA